MQIKLPTQAAAVDADGADAKLSIDGKKCINFFRLVFL